MPTPNESNALMTTLFSKELGKMFSIIKERKNSAEFSDLIPCLPITEKTSQSHRDNYGHFRQRQYDDTRRTDGKNGQVRMPESKFLIGNMWGLELFRDTHKILQFSLVSQEKSWFCPVPSTDSSLGASP